MARKKKTATKGKALVDIQKQLMADAEKEAESIGASGASTFLSTDGKSFSLGELDLGETLTVVILDTCLENAYYDRPYSRGESSPPACFATGKAKYADDLIPDDESPDQQSDVCENCPHNEWGSAQNGKGKACRNSRRLALFAYDDQGLQTDEMVMLRISPTGLARYNSFAKKVTQRLKKPTYAIVTELSFIEKETYPTVTFKCVQELSDVEIATVLEHKDDAEAMLLEGYDVSNYEPPSGNTRKRQSTKKTTTKRRSKMS